MKKALSEGHETGLKAVTPLMSQMMSEECSNGEGSAQKFHEKTKMVYMGAR